MTGAGYDRAMIHLLAETDADVHAIGIAQARAGGGLFSVSYQVIRVAPGAVPAHAAAYGSADLAAALAALPRPCTCTLGRPGYWTAPAGIGDTGGEGTGAG
jgi:hypothetical protein